MGECLCDATHVCSEHIECECDEVASEWCPIHGTNMIESVRISEDRRFE
jgi:hypothetical protein